VKGESLTHYLAGRGSCQGLSLGHWGIGELHRLGKVVAAPGGVNLREPVWAWAVAEVADLEVWREPGGLLGGGIKRLCC